MISNDRMMIKIHGNFVSSTLVVNPKYKVNNKIHWPTKEKLRCILKRRIGAIKKKMDPIKE